MVGNGVGGLRLFFFGDLILFGEVWFDVFLEFVVVCVFFLDGEGMFLEIDFCWVEILEFLLLVLGLVGSGEGIFLFLFLLFESILGFGMKSLWKLVLGCINFDIDWLWMVFWNFLLK